MTDRYRDAIIGLAAIFAAAATIAMLLAFGSLREYARDAVDLEIRLNRAGGLRYGSQITLDGVPIGTVESVSLEIEKMRPVRLDCRIDAWVRIPLDHLVKVEAALIGGGTRLAILSLDPHAGRLTYAPGEAPILVGEFQSLDEALASSLDLRMGPIADSFSEVGALAATYRELGDQIRTLVETGGSDGEGLQTTLDRVNRTLAQADRAFEAATAWLGDAQLKEDASQAIFKANLFIERATDAALAASRLANTLDEESPDLMARLAATATSVDDTLAEIRGLALRAAEGEGTVGRLLNDPALYEDLDDAAARLATTLETLRLLIDAVNDGGVKVEF